MKRAKDRLPNGGGLLTSSMGQLGNYRGLSAQDEQSLQSIMKLLSNLRRTVWVNAPNLNESSRHWKCWGETTVSPPPPPTALMTKSNIDC